MQSSKSAPFVVPSIVNSNIRLPIASNNGLETSSQGSQLQFVMFRPTSGIRQSTSSTLPNIASNMKPGSVLQFIPTTSGTTQLGLISTANYASSSATPYTVVSSTVATKSNVLRNILPQASKMPPLVKISTSSARMPQLIPRKMKEEDDDDNDEKPVPLPRGPQLPILRNVYKRQNFPMKQPAKPQQKAVKKRKITAKSRKARRDAQAAQAAFSKEMSEMKSHIQNRYESKKKPVLKKEEVGYDGPYIKSFLLHDAPGKIPVANFVIDNIQAHVVPVYANKPLLKLDKPIGPIPGMALVCSFCHLDATAEREMAMGDLIGPIQVPNEVRWQRKPGEEKAFVYLHERCLEWSSNFRMVGFEIADARAIFEDSKTECSSCKRRGATIGCSAPNCSNVFHYPCIRILFKQKCCQMIQDSHQVFCEDHRDFATKKRPTVQL